MPESLGLSSLRALYGHLTPASEPDPVTASGPASEVGRRFVESRFLPAVTGHAAVIAGDVELVGWDLDGLEVGVWLEGFGSP